MDYIIYYFIFGAVVSSLITVMASLHPYYRPTLVAWIVVSVLWPYYLPKFIMRLIRGY